MLLEHSRAWGPKVPGDTRGTLSGTTPVFRTLGDTPWDTLGLKGPKGPRGSCNWSGSSQARRGSAESCVTLKRNKKIPKGIGRRSASALRAPQVRKAYTLAETPF